MKLCYLLGLFLLGVLAKANDGEQFLKNLQEMGERKCAEAGGEDAFKNLMFALDDARICLTRTIQSEGLNSRPNSTDDSYLQYCVVKHPKVQVCYNGILEALSNCAQPDEQFFTQFIVDALDGVLNFICTEDKAVGIKLSKSVECYRSLSDVSDPCKDNFKVFKYDTPEEMKITKDEICRDLKYAKTCYGELIDKKCADSDLKVLVNEIYDAVNTACEKKQITLDTVNNILTKAHCCGPTCQSSFITNSN